LPGSNHGFTCRKTRYWRKQVRCNRHIHDSYRIMLTSKIGHFQSVLFPSFHKIGDSLVQTQLFRALKKRYPETRIVVLGSPLAREVLKNNPNISHFELTEVIPDRSVQAFWRYYRSCRELIRRFEIDTVVCDTVCSTPITAILMHLLPVRHRIYSAPVLKRRNRLFVKGLLHLNQGDAPYRSIQECNRAIVKALDGNPAAARVEIFVSDEEGRRAREYLRQSGLDRALPVISLAPFSRQQSTKWPLHRIAEFVESASGKYNLLIFCTPQDSANLPAGLLKRSSVKIIDYFNIRETFALIALTDLLVVLDSGLSHFTQCLPIPVLRLASGMAPSAQWGYDDEANYHVLTTAAPACSPCYSPFCRMEGHPCMAALSALQVLQKVDVILLADRASTKQTG
jgi:heptosyltransferase II